MSSSTEVREEVIEKGLTPRAIILSFAILLATFAEELILYISPDLRWFNAWFPLPPFLLIFIDYALGKINPRFKLRRGEWVVVIAASSAITFSTYLQHGPSYVFMMPILAQGPFMPLYFKMHPSFKKYGLGDLYPVFMCPTSPEAIDAFTYGGPFNIGDWLPFIIFWTLQWIFLVMIYVFFGFMLRKPFVEIERIPFPYVIATTEVIKMYTTVEDSKPSIFNLKNPRTKMFYIGFVLGLFFTFPGFIQKVFFPEFWGGVPYSYSFDLSTYVRSFLPGSYTVGQIVLQDIALSYLINIDILASVIIFYVIFSIIYPVLGVTMGFLPYRVGYERSQWYYGRSYGPFHWIDFMYWLPFAIGLWVFLNNWSHIKGILTTFYTGKDVVESGVSYKFISWGALISFIGFWLLWIIAGAPIIASLILIAFMIICFFGYTYARAEAGFVPWNMYSRLNLPYDIGAATLAFNWTQPDPRAFTYSTMFMASWNDGHRMTGFAMWNHMGLYKMADELKTRAKDIVIILLIMGVATAILVHTVGIWAYTAYGGWTGPMGKDTIGYAAWYAWFPLIDAKTGKKPAFWNPEWGFPYNWTLFITGILFTLGCFFARARWPWFILNPIGIFGAYGYWFWPNALVALILKYLTLKIGGTELYYKIGIPLAVGFIVGVGFLTTFTYLIFFVQALTK